MQLPAPKSAQRRQQIKRIIEAKKRQVLPQTVKLPKIPSANVPPFGSATIPPIRSQIRPTGPFFTPAKKAKLKRRPDPLAEAIRFFGR